MRGGDQEMNENSSEEDGDKETKRLAKIIQDREKQRREEEKLIEEEKKEVSALEKELG